MMKVLAMVAIVLGSVAALQADDKTDELTALHLYRQCKEGDRGYGAGYCRGVLLGYGSGLSITIAGNTWKFSCTGTDQSLQVGYVAWAEKNAARLDRKLWEVLPEMLVSEGFCRSTKIETN